MPNNDILISISEEPDATLHILGGYIGSAYSPQIEVTKTQTGHDVAITYDDAEDGITTTTFSVEDGEDGADGFSPTLSSSAITGGHRVSMTDATGTKTFDVMNGLDGADGYSPSAKVMQGDGSATITITDKDGTTTAAVQDGADGTDGFSPTATVTQTASGATISITDKSGTTTASVSNGTDGADGTDGVDGFSPTVDVQEIEGGHEVTITDAQGEHSFDVMDGDPAEPGSITDEMLAPDGIKAEVEWLWGNQLRNDLSGELIQASDAYGAPMLSLGVDGKSTQVTTTGKNLLSDIASDWVLVALDGADHRSTFIPVEDGATYCYSRLAGSTSSLAVGWAEDADGSGFVAISTVAIGQNMVNSDNHAYLVAYYGGSTTAAVASAAISTYHMQIEKGTTPTAYEPYTGRAATPRPDWPQAIQSADSLMLTLAGKQLMDWAHPFRTGSYNYDITVGTTIVQGSSANVNVSVDGSIMTVTINAAWNGAIWRSPNLPNGTYQIYFPLASDGGGGTGSSHGTTLFVVDRNNKVTRKIGTHATTGNWSWSIELSGDDAAICVNAGTRSGTYGKTFIYDSPQLEVGNVATAYEPYAGTTVPLYDGTLRSLPDGTRDTLALTYLRPSTREGWAWYDRELVQRVGRRIIDGSVGYATSAATGSPDYRYAYTASWDSGVANVALSNRCEQMVCARVGSNTVVDTDTAGLGGVGAYKFRMLVLASRLATPNEAGVRAYLNEHPLTIDYILATPVTTTLDPIELPVLPAPNCTVWADPTTGLQMEYVRDTNIVIASLEAAYADLATS